MNRGSGVARRIVAGLGCLALLASLGMSGCAPRHQWVKPGLNQAEFEQDAAQCRKQAARATYQDPFAVASGQDQGLERTMAQERLFERCMINKGYRIEGGPSGR